MHASCCTTIGYGGTRTLNQDCTSFYHVSPTPKLCVSKLCTSPPYRRTASLRQVDDVQWLAQRALGGGWIPTSPDADVGFDTLEDLKEVLEADEDTWRRLRARDEYLRCRSVRVLHQWPEVVQSRRLSALSYRDTALLLLKERCKSQAAATLQCFTEILDSSSVSGKLAIETIGELKQHRQTAVAEQEAAVARMRAQLLEDAQGIVGELGEMEKLQDLLRDKKARVSEQMLRLVQGACDTAKHQVQRDRTACLYDQRIRETEALEHCHSHCVQQLRRGCDEMASLAADTESKIESSIETISQAAVDAAKAGYSLFAKYIRFIDFQMRQDKSDLRLHLTQVGHLRDELFLAELRQEASVRLTEGEGMQQQLLARRKQDIEDEERVIELLGDEVRAGEVARQKVMAQVHCMSPA